MTCETCSEAWPGSRRNSPTPSLTSTIERGGIVPPSPWRPRSIEIAEPLDILEHVARAIPPVNQVSVAGDDP